MSASPASRSPNLFKTTGDDPFGPGPEGEPRELRPTDTPQIEPEVGGASFVFVTLPPTQPDAEVWHRTETVDINVLLGGELILVLEKEEVTLHPGDAVIQTQHDARQEEPDERAGVLGGGPGADPPARVILEMPLLPPSGPLFRSS